MDGVNAAGACSQSSSMPHSHAARLLHRAYSPQEHLFGLFRASSHGQQHRQSSTYTRTRTHAQQQEDLAHTSPLLRAHSAQGKAEISPAVHRQLDARIAVAHAVAPPPFRLFQGHPPGAHARNSTNDNTTVSGSTSAHRPKMIAAGVPTAPYHSRNTDLSSVSPCSDSSTLWFWNDATRSGPRWRTQSTRTCHSLPRRE